MSMWSINIWQINTHLTVSCFTAFVSLQISICNLSSTKVNTLNTWFCCNSAFNTKNTYSYADDCNIALCIGIQGKSLCDLLDFVAQLHSCLFFIKHLNSLRKEAGGKNTVPLSECTLTQSSNSPLRLNCKTALSWWQLLGMMLWETFVFDKCSRRQCCLASAYIFRPQHWIMNDSHGRHHQCLPVANTHHDYLQKHWNLSCLK